MSDRRSFGSPPRPDMPTRMKREFLAGVAALGLFGAAEGCAANYRPTPATPDRYGLANLDERDAEHARDPQYQQSVEIWHAWFQAYSQEAVHISPEQRASLYQRLDRMRSVRNLQEAETTLDEVRIERAWQLGASVEVESPHYVRRSPHYEDTAHQGGVEHWRARDYEQWLTLIRTFEQHPDAVHQIHVTSESSDSTLHRDGGMDTGTADGSINTNVSVRFSEGVSRSDFTSLLPPNSPRLGFERRQRTVQAVGRGFSPETSRIRAMSDLIGIIRRHNIVISERGVYFVDSRTLNRVSIERESGAVFIRDVRFITRQIEDPETHELKSETTVEAELLYNAPPAGHRLDNNRTVIRPLFPEQGLERE